MKDLISYLKRNMSSYMGNNAYVSAYEEGFYDAIKLIEKYEKERDELK